MPYAKLFRSRWAALIWAAGILWTAVDVAGFAPAKSHDDIAQATANATAPQTDVTGEVVKNSDLAILAGVMNGN
jgi:hypothetical protein